MNWKKFNGPALVAEKGAKCSVTVRGPGKPDVPVVLNAHGQAISRESGRLLEWQPTEYCDPSAQAEDPAPRQRRQQPS